MAPPSPTTEGETMTTGSTLENRPTPSAQNHPQQIEPEPCECGGKPLGFSCDPRCPASGEENPLNPAHLVEHDPDLLTN